VRIGVRRGRPSDAPAVAAIMSESIRGLAAGAYSARRVERWASLPPLYHVWAMTAGGEHYLVAGRGGRLLGYGALRGREVTALFVRPAAGRRGVGTALLRRLEREALRAGARTLRVRAAVPAVGFYAAKGFSGRRRLGVPLPGGGALPARAMTKPLLAGASRAGPHPPPTAVTGGRTAAGTRSPGTAPGPRRGRTPPPAPRSAPGRRARPASRGSTRACPPGSARGSPRPRRP
jgi:putative acetyltransferase